MPSNIPNMKNVSSFLSGLRSYGTASSNLYAIRFEKPDVLDFRDIESGTVLDWPNDLTDLYCDSVQVPARQVNTGDIKSLGNLYRYPTGVSYSQMDMTFLMDAKNSIRRIFEYWTLAIANDERNYACYYDQAVSRKVTIYKYEGYSRQTRGNVNVSSYQLFKQHVETNDATCVWELYNVFPFNLGTIDLNSGQKDLVKQNVSFYFERYRQFKTEFEIGI
jgi:hypothetical protein